MKKNFILSLAFWTGAVLDAVMVVPMLFPSIGGKMFGINHFSPGIEYRYAMMIGASLMLGWTVLLIWGAARPVERRGLLLITAFPVVAGMVLAGLFAIQKGMIKVPAMVPTWILQGILLFLFCAGFFSVKDKKR